MINLVKIHGCVSYSTSIIILITAHDALRSIQSSSLLSSVPFFSFLFYPILFLTFLLICAPTHLPFRISTGFITQHNTTHTPMIQQLTADRKAHIPMACSKQESLKHLMNICSMIASMRESMTTQNNRKQYLLDRLMVGA